MLGRHVWQVKLALCQLLTGADKAKNIETAVAAVRVGWAARTPRASVCPRLHVGDLTSGFGNPDPLVARAGFWGSRSEKGPCEPQRFALRLVGISDCADCPADNLFSLTP